VALALAGAIFAASPAFAGNGGELHRNGRSILPPPEAPGVVASTDQTEVCGIVGGLSYSKRHRATTQEMKAEVRRRDHAAVCGEIDHRLMLALGGADAIENLWCQPGPPEPWNFHLKDALELLVWENVCKHHTMTLAEGQAVFMAPDWRVGYCALIGGPPCPPSK
jgi:hypothetical protein